MASSSDRGGLVDGVKAEVRRIRELTTQELQREVEEQGLHGYLLRHPPLHKAALRAKYEQAVRRRARSTSVGFEASTNDARAARCDDAVASLTAQPAAPEAEGGEGDSSDEDDDGDNGDTATRCCSCGAGGCNLKVLLNWLVRSFYTCAIAALAFELLLHHWAGDEAGGDEGAAAAAAARAGEDASDPRACLSSVGIVFTTYVIFHRALGKTNTQVYWIQVLTSLCWLGFLVALVTASRSCPAVLHHARAAAAYCGVEDEAVAAAEAAHKWFVYIFASSSDVQVKAIE